MSDSSGPNLGEAAYWIMSASALLIRRAKYGSEEWNAANGALTALTRLQDEIRLLNETLERRAVATVPTPEATSDPARARPSAARKPAPVVPAPPTSQGGEGGPQ
jgi:hypothetical protein